MLSLDGTAIHTDSPVPLSALVAAVALLIISGSLLPAPKTSGGPGDGSFHETDVMRSIALQAGVPEEAILIDREGGNTAATAANVAQFSTSHGIHKILAVSHFYHLPCIHRFTRHRPGSTRPPAPWPPRTS